MVVQILSPVEELTVISSTNMVAVKVHWLSLLESYQTKATDMEYYHDEITIV